MRCYSLELTAQGNNSDSNCYIETLGSQNDCFCQVHPIRNMTEVSLLHDDARLHTRLCTTEAITALNGLYSSHLAPTEYELLDTCDDTITPMKATAEHHKPVAADKEEKCLLDQNTGQGWKNAVHKMETLKNNYVFSNVLEFVWNLHINCKLDFLTLEDVVDSLSHNVSKVLPPYAV
jgi:hypothetical protein